MGKLAVERKKRKDPVIQQASKDFSQSLRQHDLKRAAAIALLTTFKINGVSGLMYAMDCANAYIKRKKLRGL